MASSYTEDNFTLLLSYNRGVLIAIIIITLGLVMLNLI